MCHAWLHQTEQTKHTKKYYGIPITYAGITMLHNIVQVYPCM